MGAMQLFSNMIKMTLAVFMMLIALGFAHGHATVQKKQFEAIQKRAAIQKFLNNITPKFQTVEGEPGITEVGSSASDVNVLPEGEVLFLTARLEQRLKLQGIIFAQSRNNKIALSLKDFIQVLFFPIKIDLENDQAKGWYIREDKPFALDLNSRIAKTDQGVFEISDDVFVEEEDVFVPIDELEKWIDFEIKPRIAGQEIFIIPSQLLPLQEQFERKKKNHIAAKIPEPQLPTTEFPKKLFDVPVIDVATNLSYSKDGGTSDDEKRYNANVTTRGDFLYGTLTSRSQFNQEENLQNLQATYKQESVNSDLLGPLKARRFELGDVTTTSSALNSRSEQGLGIRITNKDPLKNLTSPTSVISGTTFPEWDVELYRGNQFLGLQTVDDNGFFSFNNVDLFNQDNDFRLVFYGPQGEIREELVSIPVDTARLSSHSGVYDVSLTLEDEQTFVTDRSGRNEDSGTLNINSLYEMSLGTKSAASLGFYSDRGAGIRNYVGEAGFSTVLNETLYNMNIAVDDEFDTSAEFVARSSFGKNDVNITTNWISSGFDLADADEELPVSILQQNLTAAGPFPFIDNDNVRYSFNGSFRETSDGESALNGNLGINTRWKGLTFNEQLLYQKSDALSEDNISVLSAISGTYGKNRIRANVDYDIKPESEISNALVSMIHEVSNDLDIRAELERNFDTRLTEGSLSMDWKAGFARLSPRVEYNSEGDVFAGLSARFSVLKEPRTGEFQTIDRNVSGNGGFSAFVYLDENGNQILDDNEEPLQDVVIKAIQNGGIENTNEDGIALFTNMLEQKLTDIVVEERSLADPLWIPGYDGLSVVPRAGHYAQAEFPIHIAGEIDGSVFGQGLDGQTTPIKNVGVELYNRDGILKETAVTDLGGFYFFSRVPPGIYYITVSEKSADINSFARPLPEKIKIDYDGTLIFGQDIIVQRGIKDVPVNLSSDYEALKELHTHVVFEDKKPNFLLNLGDYNSQIRMGLTWYKLQKQYPSLIHGGDLLVEPDKSYANPKTGKHNLRLGLNKLWNFEDAYEQCRILINGNHDCKVEILSNNDDNFSDKKSSI